VGDGGRGNRHHKSCTTGRGRGPRARHHQARHQVKSIQEAGL